LLVRPLVFGDRYGLSSIELQWPAFGTAFKLGLEEPAYIS
jgi:hypothetical protein